LKEGGSGFVGVKRVVLVGMGEGDSISEMEVPSEAHMHAGKERGGQRQPPSAAITHPLSSTYAFISEKGSKHFYFGL